MTKWKPVEMAHKDTTRVLDAADEDFVRRFRQAQRDEWWGCAVRPEPIEPRRSRLVVFLQGYGGHVLGLAVFAAVVLLSGW